MDRNSLPDDPTFGSESILWRRIHPRWVVLDETLKVLRISSAAFDNSPDGDPLSVLLAEDFEKVCRSAADVLDGHPGYGVGSVCVRIWVRPAARFVQLRVPAVAPGQRTVSRSTCAAEPRPTVSTPSDWLR